MANEWRLHLSKLFLSIESVISFFLDVSPIWLLREKTTRKDRTCDSFRGNGELRVSTGEGVEGI